MIPGIATVTGNSRMAASMALTSEDAQRRQALILPGVSRTFALTIPQLPASLRPGITNAYLLCRTADTIEDSARLTPDAKGHHYNALLDMLDNRLEPAHVAERLQDATWIEAAAERELLDALPEVVAVFRQLPPPQRDALRRCLGIMCRGMERFEYLKQPTGLADRGSFRDYCYVVAGVVGEFLTELFCQADSVIAKRRHELLALAPAFGQGLQMTNILKDVWDDRRRGICWLPRDVFGAHGCALEEGRAWHRDPAFQSAILELVAVAHMQLRRALQYTLLIPRQQTGIRRFCSWAVGMALYTLQNIRRTPGFSDAAEVKISRRRLTAIVTTCNASVGSDWLLRRGFNWAARGLPVPTTNDLQGIAALGCTA